jgi:hypothetical protein
MFIERAERRLWYRPIRGAFAERMARRRIPNLLRMIKARRALHELRRKDV